LYKLLQRLYAGRCTGNLLKKRVVHAGGGVFHRGLVHIPYQRNATDRFRHFFYLINEISIGLPGPGMGKCLHFQTGHLKQRDAIAVCISVEVLAGDCRREKKSGSRDSYRLVCAKRLQQFFTQRQLHSHCYSVPVLIFLYLFRNHPFSIVLF
jgi:hypothetical protein